MTIGEYLIVFMSIIIGLAVADLAFSLHRLLRRGAAIRWDWLMPVLALVVLCLILNVWWGIFNWYKALTEITFVGFLPDVFLVLALFLLSAAALPDERLDNGASLRAIYMGERRHIWWCFAAYLFMVMAKGTLLLNERGLLDQWLSYQWENTLFFLAAISLGFTPRVWMHGVVLGAWLVAIGVGWFGAVLR